jgi:hypothetical protein
MVFRCCHIRCYTPRCNVPIVENRDVTFGTLSKESKSAVLQWVDDWNIRWRLPEEIMPRCTPSVNAASKHYFYVRALALVFEYLQPPEVVALGSVCRDWYAASWKDAVWIHFSTLEGFTITVRPKLPSSRSCYFYSKANLCSRCKSVPQDFLNSYRSPLKPVFLCEECVESVCFVELFSLKLPRTYIEYLKVPTIKLDKKLYTYDFLANEYAAKYFEARRQAALKLLKDMPVPESTVTGIEELDFTKGTFPYSSQCVPHRIMPFFSEIFSEIIRLSRKELRLNLGL